MLCEIIHKQKNNHIFSHIKNKQTKNYKESHKSSRTLGQKREKGAVQKVEDLEQRTDKVQTLHVYMEMAQ